MEILERPAEQSQEFYDGFVDGAELFDRSALESEAWLLINNRAERPPASVQPAERRDNARTALMEALTASGHLSRVEIHGSLEDINHQVLSRLLAGWDGNLPWHEKQRRFEELCNELFIQKVHGRIVAGELDASTAVLEISDYPETLDDETANKYGYRSSNQKGMPRSTHLVAHPDGNYTRLIEQGSRAHGTSRTSLNFLAAAGHNISAGKPADIALLGKPLTYSTNEYLDGVVDVLRLLDQQTGQGILYGDSGGRAQQHAPYEELRQESARREAEIEHHIDDLAQLEQQLDKLKAEAKISRHEQLEIYKGEVNRILTAICALEPAYSKDTFGAAAESYFYEASMLIAQGNHGGAEALLAQAETYKETVIFCGMEITVKQAQEKGLQVNTFEQLLVKSRENWKWKQGLCQVKECPSRPKKTEVGPCSVCRKCQSIFDKGQDPASSYRVANFFDWLFQLKP